MRNDFGDLNPLGMVPRGGIEPPTQGFSVLWVNGEFVFQQCIQSWL